MMMLKEPSRLRYIAVGAGAGVMFAIWDSWPITSLSGLQVWAFGGVLFGSTLAGAFGGWLWWKTRDQIFTNRN